MNLLPSLRTVAALAALLLAIAGWATRPATASEDLCVLLVPCKAPARYASGPYLAAPVVRALPLRQVQAECGDPGEAATSRFGVMGCASFEGTNCIVRIAADVKAVSPSLYRLVLEHELAHCRGWEHPRY